MRTAVVGVGHVGLMTAACLARRGHDVVGMDDARKIDTLAVGTVPFREAGLQELVDEGVASGRQTFTTDAKEAIER